MYQLSPLRGTQLLSLLSLQAPPWSSSLAAVPPRDPQDSSGDRRAVLPALADETFAQASPGAGEPESVGRRGAGWFLSKVHVCLPPSLGGSHV